MTTQAKMATGAYVLYNGTVYAELTEVSPPSFSVEKVDATSHDSTHKVSIAGQTSFGDLTFKANFVNDTAQAALRVLALAKTVGTWQFVYPTTSGLPTYSVPGFVSSLSYTSALKGTPAGMSCSITPTETVTEVTTAGNPLTTAFFTIDDEHATDISAFISPAAAATTYSYDVAMPADNTGITIKPVATTGTIYVDGTIVATGVDSGAIGYAVADYPAGAIKTVFIVVTGTSKKPILYRIRLIRGITNHA